MKDKQIIVSACIITYNQASFIGECLDGAIMQAVDFGYEIVIGDDCSTDGTSEICQEYAEKFPELIKYQRRDKNLGVKKNFLQTFKECQGKYIALCEGDDYWADCNKLKIQARVMEMDDNISLSYHQSTKIDHEGNHIGPLIGENYLRDYDNIELAKGRTWISTATMMFINSKVFEEKLPDDIINLDMIIVSLLGGIGYGKYVPGINNAMYRISALGVWSQKKDSYRYNNFLKVFRVLRKYWLNRNEEVANEFKRKIQKHSINYINALFKEESRIGFFRRGGRTIVELLVTSNNVIYVLRLSASKIIWGYKIK